MPRISRYLSTCLAVLLLAGCASLALREPLRVSVAGLEPLPGEGLEARFAITLRVQNPNERSIDFNGVNLELALDGKDFASGVTDQRGSVPRYGETLIRVPVTVPLTAIVRQLLDRADGSREHIDYRLRGNLGGDGLVGATFDTRGQVKLTRPDNRTGR